MTKWTKSKGFTLIELMIVVAIIAILAAIAIPNYLRYAMKSKTAEATTNLGAIRTGETAYYAENDIYRTCADAPDGGGTDVTPDEWVTTGTPSGVLDFADIGFEPDGYVRYRYNAAATAAGGTSTSPVPASFIATATSDLDEDGELAVYELDSTATTFPKAVLETPGTY